MIKFYAILLILNGVFTSLIQYVDDNGQDESTPLLSVVVDNQPRNQRYSGHFPSELVDIIVNHMSIEDQIYTFIAVNKHHRRAVSLRALQHILDNPEWVPINNKIRAWVLERVVKNRRLTAADTDDIVNSLLDDWSLQPLICGRPSFCCALCSRRPRVIEPIVYSVLGVSSVAAMAVFLVNMAKELPILAVPTGLFLLGIAMMMAVLCRNVCQSSALCLWSQY